MFPPVLSLNRPLFRVKSDQVGCRKIRLKGNEMPRRHWRQSRDDKGEGYYTIDGTEKFSAILTRTDEPALPLAC